MQFLRTRRCSKEKVWVKHPMGESFGCHYMLLKSDKHHTGSVFIHCAELNGILAFHLLLQSRSDHLQGAVLISQ